MKKQQHSFFSFFLSPLLGRGTNSNFFGFDLVPKIIQTLMSWILGKQHPLLYITWKLGPLSSRLFSYTSSKDLLYFLSDLRLNYILFFCCLRLRACWALLGHLDLSSWPIFLQQTFFRICCISNVALDNGDTSITHTSKLSLPEEFPFQCEWATTAQCDMRYS